MPRMSIDGSCERAVTHVPYVRPLRGRSSHTRGDRRFRSLRSLHQRLWTFAPFGDVRREHRFDLPLGGESSGLTCRWVARIENLKRACREKNSSKRRRRRRISITAGGESEANATCGFTVCKWSVLEEGEHKQAVHRCRACL